MDYFLGDACRQFCLYSSCILHTEVRTLVPAQQTSLKNRVPGNWTLCVQVCKLPTASALGLQLHGLQTFFFSFFFFWFKINLVSIFWDCKRICEPKICHKTKTSPFLAYCCENDIYILRIMIPQQTPNFSNSLLGCIMSILVFVMRHPEGFQMNKPFYNSSGFGVSWFQPPFLPFFFSFYTISRKHGTTK